MDSNTQDRNSGHPSRESKDELEEALKWLEELTSRKGTTPEPSSNPIPSATIDSPFRGLIEGDEGDLPDWLREVPSTLNLEGTPEPEPESRLDWLARMAQRESIEELPTLEWRRIGEPMQSALLPPARGEAAEEIEPVPSEELETAVFIRQPAPEPTSPEPEETESLESKPDEDPLSWLGPDHDDSETYDATDSPLPAEPKRDDFDPLDFTVDFDPDDELPSVDDLDAAMAWIEELAASQDAPIEDIPSVVDRALASKLLMETGAEPSVSALDELGSDPELLGATPTHPFIEEEDFADTVVLVETIAAEQGMPIETPDEVESADEIVDKPVVLLDGEDHEAAIESFILEETEETAGLFDPPSDGLSFEEAMTYLDEVAAEQMPDQDSAEIEDENDLIADEETVGEIETAELALPDEPETSDESVAPEEFDSISYLEAKAEELMAEDVEPFVDTGSFSEWDDKPDFSEQAPDLSDEPVALSLEATLLALDAMALPGGRTLDDIDASIHTVEIEPRRDVSSVLDWLESTLVKESAEMAIPAEELDDEDLIAQMPEDPDAVLAWLEQMAEEEEAELHQTMSTMEDDSTTYISGQAATEPLAEDLAAADLLSMPDDPDEAMAWLEGLARGGVREQARETADAIESEAIPSSDEPIEVIPKSTVEAIDFGPEEAEALVVDIDELEEITSRPAETALDETETPIDDAIDTTIDGAEEVVERAREALEAAQTAATEAVDETIDAIDETVDEVVVEPVATTVELVETAADESVDALEATVDEVIDSYNETDEEIVIDPVEEVIKELEVAADELLSATEDEIEAVEVELATAEPLSLNAQDIEELEAEALSRGVDVVEEIVVEPAAIEEPIAAEATAVEEADATETVVVPAKAKRQRAKTAKTKVEDAPATGEPPSIKERPGTSWVDLLKPLD